MSVQLSRRYAILGLSKLPKYVYKGHDLDCNKSSTFARNAITYQAVKSNRSLVSRAYELQCFDRSFSTSKILDADIFRGAKEIHSERINAGRRQYFIDLKYDIEGRTDRAPLLVKLSERTMSTNRKTSILIDFGDLNTIIHNLKQGFDPDSYEKVSTCYASYQSKKIENKKYEFFASDNDNGKVLKIVESRGDQISNIFVTLEYVHALVGGLEQVLSFGESYLEDVKT